MSTSLEFNFLSPGHYAVQAVFQSQDGGGSAWWADFSHRLPDGRFIDAESCYVS
jgi:hypothetical protein